MRIGITGASGLIGSSLCEHLLGQGHELVLLGRRPEILESRFPGAQVGSWQAESSGSMDPKLLEGLDAFVHLAGESIAGKRWSDQRKRAIRDSRVEGTSSLVRSLGELSSPPKVFLSGSAIGYYGDRGNETLDELAPSGSGYLSDVCVEWEDAAMEVRDLGIRCVTLRTGIVLSTKGGALEKILPPFRMFMGGPLGHGSQWMSWIHLMDEIQAICCLLDNDKIEGPVNLVAPHPVTNREFSKVLGSVLKRPSFFPVPGFALKILVGEMAEALLLGGQRVLPGRLSELGFDFEFPDLRRALEDLL